MQFISTTFLLFLPITFLIYHFTNKDYRYLVLLVANYIFYAWNNLSAVPILLFVTALTYFGGLALEKKKKRGLYILFFCATLLVLAFYKYLNFSVDNLNKIAGRLIGKYAQQSLLDIPNIIAPIGLSFFIFQSTSYLNDVYRKNMPAEKNFFRFAAFVSFFPTVLSGPIQRSRDLLPQLKKPADFSLSLAKSGFLLLVWGFFQKIVVATKLALISNTVFNDYTQYSPIYYILAAVSYSLYIYCDFSSYSDMACGVAQMLGFQIRPNFRNPYLAETLTDFWNRWHMSLNTWFVENVYIPLGGNRKGKYRKYLNIFCVFFFSGIWHGASWHFIIWGVLNALLRIFGEILSPIRSRIYSALRIDEACGSIRTLKKITVFVLITFTWIFFRMPATTAAIQIIRGILSLKFYDLFNTAPLDLLGTPAEIFSFIIFVGIFLFVQYLRKEDGKISCVLEKQPKVIQYMLITIMISLCIFSICSESTTFNTQFIYFDF